MPYIATKKLHTAESSYKTVLPDPTNRDQIKQKIKLLCEKRNAVILAHYYQDELIQDIAHFIGDSLELSRQAAATNADVIVFCGVHFMAETAKILSPEKTVIIPDLEAGCSLADECPENEFKSFIKQHPEHYVISYINCSAAVKAQSDLICTSSNAVDLVKKIPENIPIIFAPDKNLGRWVEKQSGRTMKLWDGSCTVHETFNEEELIKLQIKYPNAEVIAHPECTENLLNYSNFIGSTSKLLEHVQTSPINEFIVLTEPGIIHQMKIKEPKKYFYDVPGIDGCSCNECPYMRLNTLEKVKKCLEALNPELKMDEKIRSMAYKPLKRMLDMSS